MIMRLGIVCIVWGIMFFTLPMTTYAEVKSYEGIGEYMMSDFETPDVGKQRAKSRAEQNCVEQAGVYIESYTSMVNASIVKDEVIAIASSIINITDVTYEVVPITGAGGGFRIVAKIHADIDNKGIDKWLRKDYIKKQGIIDESRKLQEESVKLENEITELKNKINAATDTQSRNSIKVEISAADQKFMAERKVKEAWKLINRYKYEEAEPLLLQAIKHDDNSIRAYSLLGLTYTYLNDYEKAFKYFDKCIAIDPQYIATYKYRSSAYDRLNEPRKAIKDINKVLKAEPENLGALITHGYIYRNCYQDYEQALSDFNKVIKLNPNYALAYANRGVIYMARGDEDKALADYNKAIEVNPKDYSGYSNRGNLYNKQGKYKEAIADFSKAVELNPKNYRSYCNMGFSYYKIGDIDKAIYYTNKAIEANSHYEYAKKQLAFYKRKKMMD